MGHESFSIVLSNWALNLSPPSPWEIPLPFSSSLPSSAHCDQARVSEIHKCCSCGYYRPPSNCQKWGRGQSWTPAISTRAYNFLEMWPVPLAFLWLLGLCSCYVLCSPTHSSSLIKCWSSSQAIRGFPMFYMLSLGGPNHIHDWVPLVRASSHQPWWGGMFLTSLQLQTKYTQQL